MTKIQNTQKFLKKMNYRFDILVLELRQVHFIKKISLDKKFL